jgi:hypothetical protein
MISPASVCLFVPAELKKFKLDLFNRIGRKIEQAGGRVIRGDYAALDALPDAILPIVGCSPQLKPLIDRWRARGRGRIQWDRGYARRIFATHLPRGADGGYYRWHLNAFQMQRIRDVHADRWLALLPGNRTDPRKLEVLPWSKGGSHIVIAQPTPTYAKSHGIEDWTEKTLDALALLTDRQLVVRGKESKRPLQADLKGAHCLVAHGSITAVEAVICGCPVFVHPDSAAALVGLTDLKRIEAPIYPERERWLWSLAYCQFNEAELVDGTLWRLLD